MRILHTTHSYFPSLTGVAEVVEQVSRRLAESGHVVSVATARVGRSPERELLNGVNVFRFAVTGNLVNGMSGRVDWYRDFVVNGDWDIVVMHCAQTWTTDALLDALKKFRFPFILVSHGLSAWTRPEYASYFATLAEAMRTAEHVVSLSPVLEETAFCDHFGLGRPRFIANGVDMDTWTSGSARLRHEWNVGPRPWLLTVGNHSSVKGHDRFFRVAGAVRRKIPALYSCIVGSPHPAARYGLGRIGVPGGCWISCLAHSVVSDVQLKSNIKRSDTIAAIKEASVIAITSRREAFPLVALEAMAAGTPWVSFDVGNLKENVGGLVVRTENEMSAAIVRILLDPVYRQSLSEQGRLRVRDRHDWKEITKSYEALYLDACARGKG